MPIEVDKLNEVLRLADKHQKRLAAALVKLETRLVDIMAEAPLRDGRLFDLEWAVKARPVLWQAIEAEYLGEIDSILRDYKGVAAEALKVAGTYSEFATLDPAIVSQLQGLNFSGFSSLGDEFLEAVSQQVYESTLTGVSFANSVAIIRSSVASDLGRHAGVALHDSMMGFWGSVNTKIALDAGATSFKYFGPDDEATRPFCDRHVGKTYTKEEIERIWQGEWAGKKSGDPFVVRGGYNCRHHFQAVFDI